MNLRYFKLAKRVAQKSPSKFKLGCVIANKKRIISFAFNDMSRTHPKSKTHGNFLHAEIRALIGLSYEETRGANIFIYRETLNGEIARSKPCDICYNMLINSGIKNIYYTSEHGYHKL